MTRLLRARRGSLLASHHRSSRDRWPEESVYLLVVSADRRDPCTDSRSCRRRAAWRQLLLPLNAIPHSTSWLLLQMLAGLLLLGFATYKFHKRASERSDALAQLRAAKQARGSDSGSGDRPVGLASGDAAGRRGGVVDVLDAAHGAADALNGVQGLVEEARLQAEQVAGSADAAADMSGEDSAAAGLAGTQAAAADGVAGERPAGAGGQLSQEQGDLSSYCERHFGLEWLQRWGATARRVCTATQQLVAGAAGGGAAPPAPSAVTCLAWNDTHMPAAAAPHVLCDATNLRLYPSKLVRTGAAAPGMVLHTAGRLGAACCLLPAACCSAPGAASRLVS